MFSSQYCALYFSSHCIIIDYFHNISTYSTTACIRFAIPFFDAMHPTFLAWTPKSLVWKRIKVLLLLYMRVRIWISVTLHDKSSVLHSRPDRWLLRLVIVDAGSSPMSYLSAVWASTCSAIAYRVKYNHYLTCSRPNIAVIKPCAGF